MDSPGKGKEDEFAEAVRDCEIVEQLFALAMEKETAESTQDMLSFCSSQKQGFG